MASYKEALREYIYKCRKICELENKIIDQTKRDLWDYAQQLKHPENEGKIAAFGEVLQMMENLK